MSLSVAKKMTLIVAAPFGVAMLALLILAYVLGSALSQTEQQSHGAQITSARLLSLIEVSTQRQNGILKLVREQDADSMEALISRDSLYLKNAMATIDTLGTSVSDVSTSLKDLNKINTQVINKILLGDNTGAQEMYIGESTPAFEKLTGSISASYVRISSEIQLAQVQLNKSVSTKKMTVIALSILLLVAVGFWGLLLGKSIINALHATTHVLEDIAHGSGDLTKRIKISGDDEIGRLSTHFNAFVEKLHGLVASIAQNMNPLTSAADSLGVISSEIAQISDGMSNKSSQVVRSASEAARSTVTMSSAAKQMSSDVAAVASAAEEMSASLSEVAKNCVRENEVVISANRNIESTRDIIHTLHTSAINAAKMVDVINKIADQTNLLALNATIEAASAGEYGKGFTVVASEVKALAKQTAKTTDEIRQLIETMQVDANKAVEAVTNTSTVIESLNIISKTIVSAVEEQSATIHEIAQSMTSAHIAASEIASNVEQSAANLATVSDNMNHVDRDIVATAGSTQNIAKQSAVLQNLSTQLQNVVGQFKL